MSVSAPDPGGQADELSVPAAQTPLQGPQGEQGERGPKGEPGESVLVPLAENMVQQLVEGAKWSRASIEKLDKLVKSLRKVIIALVLLFAMTGACAGYLLNESLTHPLANELRAEVASEAAHTKALELYVQQYAQHGCQALSLLTASPVAKPPDPASNPSREVTYEFYEALLYWERADGCKTG